MSDSLASVIEQNLICFCRSYHCFNHLRSSLPYAFESSDIIIFLTAK